MTKLFVFTIAALCAFSSFSQHTEKLRELYYQENYQGVTDILVDDELLEPEDLFIIANAFHKLEDFEMAVYYYELSHTDTTGLKDYYLNRAICEISIGDVESAERHLFMYEDQMGEHPMVYYYFGVIDYEMLEYKTAEISLQKAVDLSPEYMEAWYLLGAVLMEQEKYSKATKCFEEAIHLKPNHEKSKLYLAVSLMNCGEYKESMDILEKLSPDTTEFKAEILYFIGEANFLMHNEEAACSKWNEAADLGDTYAVKALKNVCEKKKPSRHKIRQASRVIL